jgi:hypothetical protein
MLSRLYFVNTFLTKSVPPGNLVARPDGEYSNATFTTILQPYIANAHACDHQSSYTTMQMWEI